MMKKYISMITLILGFVGGILAIGVAIVQYVDKKNEEKQKIHERQEKIEQEKETKKYQKKFEDLLIQQKDSLSEVLDLNQKLVKVQEENAKLSEELLKQTTGGDSYCYLKIYQLKNDNYFRLACIHHGKYRLENIEMRIVDLDEFDENAGNITYEFITKNTISIGTLYPNTAKQINAKLFMPSDNRMVRLNIFFSASNGFFTQLVRLRFIKGSYREAWKVTRNNGGVLNEYIDSEYGMTSKEIFEE